MTSVIRQFAIATVASLLSAPVLFGQGGAPASASSSASSATTGSMPRFAYVNSQKILADAPGRAEAGATFDKEAATVKTQVQQMEDSMRALAAAFDKDAPGLDSAHRELRGKMLRDREQEYQQRAQDLNQQLQLRQADLVRPLMEQISKVLDEFRVQGNYTMIFDVGTQANVIVSADKSLDITDQVIARLKQLGPPPPASGTTPTPSVGPSQKPAGVTRPRG